MGRGKSAQEAFSALVSDARHSEGHGGYTGTIAEKHSFTMIPLSEPPEDLTIEQHAQKEAQRLIEKDDPRVCDKWGPAGCFDLRNGKYLFFGWASE